MNYLDINFKINHISIELIHSEGYTTAHTNQYGFYHLGLCEPNIQAAILVYENNFKKLTDEEKEVMIVSKPERKHYSNHFIK